MPNPIDISPDSLEIILDILRKYLLPNTRVWVFGSRAKWTTHDGSDLDLAVEGTQPIDYDVMINMSIEFDDSNLPYTVDIVDLRTISSNFKKIINAQKIPLLFANQNNNSKIQSNETTFTPKNWIHAVFSDVIDIDPKRNLKKDTIVKFVSMENLKPFTRKISNYTIKNYSSGSKFQNGDILFARITPSLENGKTAYVDFLDKDEIGAGSTEFIILAPKDKRLDSIFVYYLSRTTMVRDIAIKSMTGTSDRQRVKNDIFKKINITIPLIQEQNAIAKILSDLDSKIELNNKMNQTMERIARRLFKSWFVNFEPVRAKMDGRWKRGQSLPGLPSTAYDLFPDTLVDSELGMIPEGWKTNVLENCFDLVMGQSPPSDTYNDEQNGLPFFQGSADFGLRYPTNRKYCTEPTCIVHTDDTLISVRAPVGAINMAWETCCIGRGIVAIRHKTNSRSFTYYYMWSLQKDLKQYESMGTVFGAVTKKQLENILTVEPPINLIHQFETHLSAYDKCIRTNTYTSRSLTNIRDMLLPKLLSGKIRIQTMAQK